MQLDLLAALEKKRVGMGKSEAANTAWIATRLLDLEMWVHGRSEFKMEFFRGWCEIHGFIPTDHHAWGALTATAVREGIIEWTGRYAQAASKKTHAHPVKVWRPKGAA